MYTTLGLKSYDFSALHILVADKHSFMRRTMRSVLRIFNVGEVIDAGSLEAAWDTFQTLTPDLVFLDWSPGYDGLMLLRRIRQDQDSTNTFAPVIITSSLTEPEHIFKARDAGMTEFVAKPYSPQLIYSRLCAVTENPRAFVRSGDYFGPDRRRKDVTVDEDRRRYNPDNLDQIAD